ncbi:MAG: hypothetical protein Kow0022_05220 [Phycisphaerales bacterium]
MWYRLHRRPQTRLKDALLSGAIWRGRERFWALRGLTFACEQGQSLAVMGGNGAGKSTLCLALAGIIQPDEGTIIARGGVTPLLGLGGGLSRQLTGRQNIGMMAAFMGIPRKQMRRRAEEIIEFSGLGAFIDQPVTSYSSGMAARLAFSIASSFDPDILILDEVLGVGDQEFRQRSRERIMELMRSSRLIVIVSHSLDFLGQICTHGLWIERGQQRAFGEVSDVIAQYRASNRLPGCAQGEDA